MKPESEHATSKPRNRILAGMAFVPKVKAAPVTTHIPMTPVTQTIKPRKDKVVPKTSLAVNFLGAGLAACIAEVVTFPLDTAKVRLQVMLFSFTMVWQIRKDECIIVNIMVCLVLPGYDILAIFHNFQSYYVTYLQWVYIFQMKDLSLYLLPCCYDVVSTQIAFRHWANVGPTSIHPLGRCWPNVGPTAFWPAAATLTQRRQATRKKILLNV